MTFLEFLELVVQLFYSSSVIQLSKLYVFIIAGFWFVIIVDRNDLTYWT